MKVTVTNSGNIKSLEHDDKNLHVEFLNNKIYEYKDVPKSVFLELVKAESIGKYFIANISKKYKYELKN